MDNCSTSQTSLVWCLHICTTHMVCFRDRSNLRFPLIGVSRTFIVLFASLSFCAGSWNMRNFGHWKPRNKRAHCLDVCSFRSLWIALVELVLVKAKFSVHVSNFDFIWGDLRLRFSKLNHFLWYACAGSHVLCWEQPCSEVTVARCRGKPTDHNAAPGYALALPSDSHANDKFCDSLQIGNSHSQRRFTYHAELVKHPTETKVAAARRVL